MEAYDEKSNYEMLYGYFNKLASLESLVNFCDGYVDELIHRSIISSFNSLDIRKMLTDRQLYSDVERAILTFTQERISSDFDYLKIDGVREIINDYFYAKNLKELLEFNQPCIPVGGEAPLPYYTNLKDDGEADVSVSMYSLSNELKRVNALLDMATNLDEVERIVNLKIRILERR